MSSDQAGPPPAFASPLLYHHREPITLVELRMRRFSGLIRAKPDWWEKVHDASIAAKWRAEMVEQDKATVEKFWSGTERFDYGRGEKLWPRDPITDSQLDYIFDQLKYEAGRRDAATGIFATSIPNIYESRSLIPVDIKSPLLALVSALEGVPEDQKDWHPGSNGQVLDLLHPSLYPLRIAHSYVRDKNPDGEAHGVHVLTRDEYLSQRPDFEVYRHESYRVVSDDYQWLPTDFDVSATGDVVASAYINNLHPDKHRTGYAAISAVLSRFIPLFERVTSDMISPPPPFAIIVEPTAWYDHLQMPDFGDWDILEEDDPEEKWDEEVRWPLIPDPPPFAPPSSEGRVDVKLRGRTVQVIVKLSNIVLTPENPKYPGGSWHVEGMANEKIVATGLYYYSCENITQSRLVFRTVVGGDPADYPQLPYEQSDNRGYYTVFGFGGGDPLNQELGHVVAEEGKCIAFPNIYQHRVDPFELADPTKPGHRKILCFFLVDPHTRIHSTSDAAPQQEEWLMDEMVRIPALQKLPAELFKMISDYATAGTMSRKEAEQHREWLMDERKEFVMTYNEEVYEVEFNMCEH